MNWPQLYYSVFSYVTHSFDKKPQPFGICILSSPLLPQVLCKYHSFQPFKSSQLYSQYRSWLNYNDNPISQGLTVIKGSFSIWFWLLHSLLKNLANFFAFSGPSSPSKKTGQWYYLSSFIDLPIILVIIQSLGIALWLDPCPELWSYCESLSFFLNFLLWRLSPGYLEQLYSVQCHVIFPVPRRLLLPPPQLSSFYSPGGSWNIDSSEPFEFPNLKELHLRFIWELIIFFHKKKK